MLNSRTSQTILMIIAVLLFIFMGLEMMRPGTLIKANKPPEQAPQQYTVPQAPPQAIENAYNPATILEPARQVYHGETIYTPSFNPKETCRVEYQLTGMIQISQLLEIHNLKVEQAPGTPGGTTITGGEVADYDPWPINVRIISNTVLDLVLMLDMVKPPKGWLKGKWSDDSRYQPKAVIVYQNCLATRPLPKR